MNAPTARTLRRIAILNRGEPAQRFLRGLREYNLQHGTRIAAVAFYTDPDARAAYVQWADDAVSLGAPMRPTPEGGTVSAYCDHDHVVRLLKERRCDAVWPGWGFASEDAAFVARLEEAGIVFLGPSSAAMRALGDKIASKELAEQAGVPLATWRDLTTADADTIVAAGDEVGFPLMVKASAGGGGRGIRKVRQREDLLGLVESARDEATKAFGHGGLFVEACIENARHVEVQLIADAHGGAWAVGVRDCTMQRRNQKIIEETPSPVLPDEAAQRICKASVRLAKLAGYVGAGTAEYLYKPEDGTIAFLEVNSRLQVEHTITEMVSGADLVHAQITIARGLAWEAPDETRGVAIEARLNAEDPEKGFAPAPGLVRVFRAPSGPGVRVDSGVTEGSTIAPEFDSMIAKIIVWGETRALAIARLRRALSELEVVIENGVTNKAFLLQLLDHPAYVENTASTMWLDGAMADGWSFSTKGEREALIVAGIISYRLELHAEMQRFFAEAQNGVPQNLKAPEGVKVRLRLRGRQVELEVFSAGRDHFIVESPAGPHRLQIEPTGPHSAMLLLDGVRHRITYAYGRTGISVEVDGVLHTVERSTGGEVRAPAPAMVVAVAVSEGDEVAVGDRLCTLEAMKMEMPVFAEEAGIVKAVLCRANQQVIAGQTMLVLQPDETEETDDRGFDLDPSPPRPLDILFDLDIPHPELLDEAPPQAVRAVIRDVVDVTRAIMLGYEVPTSVEDKIQRLFGAKLNFNEVQSKAEWGPLLDMLRAFVDASAVFERNALPRPGAPSVSPALAFYDYCRMHHQGEDGASPQVRELLLNALRWFGVTSLEPTESLREALYRLSVGHAHTELRHRLCSSLLRLVIGLHEVHIDLGPLDELHELLERIVQLASPDYPYVADNARQALYVTVREPHYVARDARVNEALDDAVERWREDGGHLERGHLESVVATAQTVLPAMLGRMNAEDEASLALFDAVVRRLYETRELRSLRTTRSGEVLVGGFQMEGLEDGWRDLIAATTPESSIVPALDRVLTVASTVGGDAGETSMPVVDVVLQDTPSSPDWLERVARFLKEVQPSRSRIERLTVTWFDELGVQRHRTFMRLRGRLLENAELQDVHAEVARRVGLHRMAEFELERIASPERVHAFRARARSNAKDERVFVVAEVFGRATPPEGEEDSWPRWEFEKAFYQGLRILRDAQATRTRRNRFFRNRLTIFIRPTLDLREDAIPELAARLEAPTRRLGLEGVHIIATTPDGKGGTQEVELVLSKPGRHRLEISTRLPATEPIRALTRYEQRVVRARRIGQVYPYEIVRMLVGSTDDRGFTELPVDGGRFQEYDLDESGDTLVPVARPYGENTCGVVVGRIENRLDATGPSIERVAILSDCTRAMGALAEAECRRVVAALDLADSLGVPVEWIAISAGARISMSSGTENLDWTAKALQRIVTFTQSGGDIHVIVPGVNVGAQSYWNAEATMLMHTAGVLIMTTEGSMVLTGKKALEYSGAVAAEDERGIGGYERIMGPNGQAQYVARDLGDAYRILFNFYRYAYRRRGELSPQAATTDPAERSILESPYETDETFATIGEIFDDATNPGRKKPFAIREVMRAVVDQDGGHLERWQPMRHAETVVVWDAFIGGHGVSVIGVESQPLPRFGRVPVDGPETWTGGTLFPRSSKKLSRAINAASGRRPLVILANLSGFDGSPESLRELQLEYGAEIGRAVVNFDGPIVFVVVGRYHGGAYVVFSKALNPSIRAMALRGTYASVIGGAPAAAVVFPREVRKRAESDARVLEARKRVDEAPEVEKPRLREELDELYATVLLEHQGELATEFDAIHSVERAVSVGSLDAVIAPEALRPRIIAELDQATGRLNGESEGAE